LGKPPIEFCTAATIAASLRNRRARRPRSVPGWVRARTICPARASNSGASVLPTEGAGRSQPHLRRVRAGAARSTWWTTGAGLPH